MLKQLFYSATIISILFVLGSCSQDKKKETDLSPINPKVEELDEVKDNSFLSILKKVEGDKMVITTLEGKTRTYDFSEARSSDMIKGSLTTGDTLSVFPDDSNEKVLISINVSELSGRWFYDMKQHRGLTFEKHGAITSINTDDISFREWKVLNGKLYIYFVDMQQLADDRHQYLVEEADILHLNRQSLDFTFNGRDYKCKRLLEAIKFGG